MPDAPVPLAVGAFVLLACHVTAVHHLELRSKPQAQRRHVQIDGRWQVIEGT